jgi:hypothetical protein
MFSDRMLIMLDQMELEPPAVDLLLKLRPHLIESRRTNEYPGAFSLRVRRCGWIRIT